MMVQLGIPLAADAEQAEIDQPDRTRNDALAVHVGTVQVLRRSRAQGWQRAGKPQHVSELLSVALLPP
jgi:hypothetical protein